MPTAGRGKNRGQLSPMPRLTKQTLDAAAMRAEFATIRDQGIATERDEAVLGESSAAAPIFDHAGSAVGAIGVVDSTERIFPKGLAKGLAAAVGEAARGSRASWARRAGRTPPRASHSRRSCRPLIIDMNEA
jgi:DNA-binding IclR family transcriptional regulator